MNFTWLINPLTIRASFIGSVAQTRDWRKTKLKLSNHVQFLPPYFFWPNIISSFNCSDLIPGESESLFCEAKKCWTNNPNLRHYRESNLGLMTVSQSPYRLAQSNRRTFYCWWEFFSFSVFCNKRKCMFLQQ